MNRSNENNITNSSSVIIKEAFDALVSKLNVVQMREHVTERSLRTEFADIPESMLGAYYVYSMIARSGNGLDDPLMKAGEFVLGLFDGSERVWLEFNGWYLLADGYTSICSGSISNVPHTAYERTRVFDMFQLFSNAFRRIN